MQHVYRNANDAHTIGLQVIGWIVAEPGRAERFLSLTGLDSAQLRAGLEDGSVVGAALDFLLQHEPDLLACTDALDLAPLSIAAAREALV